MGVASRPKTHTFQHLLFLVVMESAGSESDWASLFNDSHLITPIVPTVICSVVCVCVYVCMGACMCVCMYVCDKMSIPLHLCKYSGLMGRHK